MILETKSDISAVEEAAARIFGSADSPSYLRWVEYWKRTGERTRELLRAFEAVVLLELEGRRVLDLGCGTGDLAGELTPRGCRYAGIDYHRHVLRLSPESRKHALVQGNGIALPFPRRSFDLILAFDVIEHLTGGKAWQSQFLTELERVLTPQGIVFLTTPNFWHPYDAHTGLNGPQFLPRFLRERYIRRRNPGFIQEHGSFDGIRLMKPGFLKRALASSGLTALHDLPCCLDCEDYRQIHPFAGRLAGLGLGWIPHAEFWMVLGRREVKQILRRRLRKNWPLEHAQPDPLAPDAFCPVLDFERRPFGHQLGKGWHWHEQANPAYRWIEKEAVCYLLARPTSQSLFFRGFPPNDNRVEVRVNGTRVGDARLPAGKVFQRDFLIPARDPYWELLEVRFECHRTFQPGGDDLRELGIMVFQVGLEG